MSSPLAEEQSVSDEQVAYEIGKGFKINSMKMKGNLIYHWIGC